MKKVDYMYRMLNEKYLFIQLIYYLCILIFSSHFYEVHLNVADGIFRTFFDLFSVLKLF